ncbi:Eco57I restriction-modification methylase domain-containing protein [Kitasatospora sp. LaBMicrA B282]|uniref:Eco57I restriction-modification methylase domain-containing protein n=1 Tax=Kitasatospora sp. LaBMicrA B282 TaxID=3420949 RepID=UPI003D1416EB
MTYDSLVNEGEYFPAFYLDEILPTQLKNGPLKQWTAKERAGEDTPRQGLRNLSVPYLAARAALRDAADKFNATEDVYAVAVQQAGAEALKSQRFLEHDELAAAVAHANPEPGAAWASDSSHEAEWRTALASWHDRLLRALGYNPAPSLRIAHSPAGTVPVPVALSEDQLVVLTGGFATSVDQVRGGGEDGSGGAAGRLPAPVRVGSGKTLTTVTDLAAWLLSADNPPRYALLLFGGVMILADREHFARGRYLAVSLDVALPRKGAKGANAGELDVIAALFGADSLRLKEDGKEDDIARFVAESRDHSVGVTGDLRKGLQASVQLIANEVLNLVREQKVRVEDLAAWLPDVLKEPGDLPKLLTTESLRYLYRILFLLYAEARPELDILPMKSEEYVTGYSVSRLRELVIPEKLTDTRARRGHHFHDSLALLFDKVFTGHPVAETVSTRDAMDMGEAAEISGDDGQEGVRIEALRSRLFDPTSIRLVGQKLSAPSHGAGDSPEMLDLRLRNDVLHKVLRHLTLIEGKGRYGRGGFISYANLSINHLGAVYEGLMSYTGFIMDEVKYEVAKGGDPEAGSWLITGSQVASGRYPDTPGDSVFVKRTVNKETREEESATYPVGTYVYRLAGRDRQTSASYYTPESLTQATVEQALRFRLDPEGKVDPKEPEKAWVNAADVLRWRVCEPALGSGAFLNEAVNQLAELYLRLAERERGVQIDPEEYQREFQKAKAYIALHNAYGVDLNDTAVELAEISLWLNTMYPGMKAPWYGLHLHRGNSLIGASRKVYPGNALHEGGWLRSKGQAAPKEVPLGQPLPGQAVHQFLLPALGWGSVVDDVSVRKPKKGAADQTETSVVAGVEAEWLEPEIIEAMTKWRAGLRRAPKGGGAAKKAAAARKAAPETVTADVALPFEDEHGQGALDLGFDTWQQGALNLSGSASGGRGMAAAKRVQRTEVRQEESEQSAQVGRLMALAQRVEYLWQLVVKRLQLSEQEIARTVGVWGASADVLAKTRVAAGGLAMDRDAVLAALHAEGSPYWRLRQVMDAWCSLWFWPLEEVGLLNGTDRARYFQGDIDLTKIKKGYPGRKTALKSLDDWIEFAEAVVGRVDVDSGKQKVSFFEVAEVTDLEQLDEAERNLDAQMIDATAWEEPYDLGDLFPWYGTAYRIARERGFFHWELDFAHVFAEGGFDLMVGNPPWVKQEWKESSVLAEFEPWFELADQPSNEEWAERKAAVLAQAGARSTFLGELADSAAMSSFMASVDAYPELSGTQPDLYRAFMLQSWRAIGEHGIAGLLHPSTHLTGSKDGTLRRAAYRRLRLHADFANELYLFAKPVMNDTRFSVNVYGSVKEIKFQHISWLFHPQVLLRSLGHDGVGPLPAIKRWDSEKDKYTWDLRAHGKRILVVDRNVLEGWRALIGEEGAPPVEETRILFPVTTSEESAIHSLASWPYRIGGANRRISRGYDEKNDRTAGYFVEHPGPVDGWKDVILQGSFIGVATPYSKQPPPGGSKTMRDYERWDHFNLIENAVPRTNYRRAGSLDRFIAAQDRWIDTVRFSQLLNSPAAVAAANNDIEELLPEASPSERRAAVQQLLADASKRPYSEFYRVAWREMNRPKNERVLQAAIIPPGPTHIHAVRSMALEYNKNTVLVAGFFSAIPLEYLLRITNRVHMDVSDADVFPAPISGHPLASALELRTLRLNCQTSAYAALWSDLYDSRWVGDEWAAQWQNLSPLSGSIGSVWTRDTPLRTERSRRAAIVELDALVAVWLGIEADALIAMYHSRFPVLRQYEDKMWFDASGRRISYAPHARGYGQPEGAWKQLISHGDFPVTANVPTGYTGPLYRANREAEMRAAHAEFTRRMLDVGWVPGATKPGLSATADTFDPSHEHRAPETSSSEHSHTTGGGSAS